jgi:hypothetical protein
MDVDGFANDPGHWGASLANDAELLFGALEAAGARSVLEVGAYAGDVTRPLLEWAGGRGGRVIAVDPDPHERLQELDEQRADLTLVRETSLEALAHVELPDAVIIDGDHNYFTVSEELRLIGERAPGDALPLLLFHDVCWPHARRDDYFDPALVPETDRQPEVVDGATLFPNVPGIHPGGLPFRHAAAQEGGPRNGVLTAIEDFVAAREDLRLVVVPAFFGFGAVWHTGAPSADALAAFLDPWDRNPLLERLEANRALHLASSWVQLNRAAQAEERDARKSAFLRKLLESKSFEVAIRISRLRQRGEPAFSKDEVRALLD